MSKKQKKIIEIDETGQENSDDISGIIPSNFLDAALWSTDWTVETILSQLTKGNIQLDPKFQRRDAWDMRRKSLFIESLILGLPIPQIILAEKKDERGSYIVIDGKQRLLSIRQFCSDDKSDFPSFKLTKLDVLTQLKGNNYEELKRMPEFQKYRVAFENQSIRTVVIRSWPNEDYLFTVFLRLNTGSLQLSPQELRQALHPGPFVDFATDASESELLQDALGIDKPDRRMRDIEIIVRFFAFRNFVADYNGKLKEFLDDTCKILNEKWLSVECQLKEQKKQLDEAIKFTNEIFEEDAFSVWYKDAFTGKFNRPVFDIMTYYFSEPSIRKSFGNRPIREKLKRKFINLCEKDVVFINSLLISTKDREVTRDRFVKWGKLLQSETKKNIKIPFSNNI